MPTSRKEPLSLETLLLLINSHTLPHHNNILFIMLTLCGFFGLHRLRELTHPNTTGLWDYQKLIKHSSISLIPQTFLYTLPEHKADCYFNSNTVLIARCHDAPDLHSWFLRYLASYDAYHPAQSSLWLHKDGSVPTSILACFFHRALPVLR